MGTRLETVLLSAFLSEDGKGSLIIEIVSTQESEKIAAVLCDYSRADQEALWKSAYDCIQKNVDIVILLLSKPENLETSKTEYEVATKIILSAVKLLSIHISVEKPSIIPTIIQINEILKHLLPVYKPSDSSLRKQIVKYFVLWWKKQLFNKDILGLSPLTYFLNIILEGKSNNTVWNTTLELMPCLASSEGIVTTDESLVNLLIKCFTSNHILHQDKGITFLSHILCLNSSLTLKFHKAVEDNILISPPKMGKLYGNIYYSAWLNSKGEVKETLETKCIHEFVHFALNGDEKKQKNAMSSLRNFLQVFHLKKTHMQTLTFIIELYAPVLWRAFDYPNSKARNNAAKLFFDVAPMIPPNSDRAAKELSYCTQIDIIKELLLDTSVDVRKTAIQGVCSIFCLFWNDIPSICISSVLKILIERLLIDASNASVRSQVIQGLMIILDCKLSHVTMKQILPRTSKSVHDVNSTVRFHYMQLLQKVKSLRFMQFWKIVPVRQLLGRLSQNESSRNKTEIVRIIRRCYFVPHEVAATHVANCIGLIDKSPDAARNFFAVLSREHLISPEVSVEFMRMSIELIYRHSILMMQFLADSNCSVYSDDKENTSTLNQQDKPTAEDIEKGTALLSDNKTAVILMECVTLLYPGIVSELKKDCNKKMMKIFFAHLSERIPSVFLYYKTADAEMYHTLIYFCGHLPTDIMGTLTTTCISELGSLSEDCKDKEFMPFVLSLIWQRKPGTLMDILTDWLDDLHPDAEMPKRNRRIGAKSVRFEKPLVRKPYLAIRVLRRLLDAHLVAPMLLEAHEEKIQKELWRPLESFKGHILKMAQTSSTGDLSEATIFRGFELYCYLTLLIYSDPEGEIYAPRYIEELLNWSLEEVVPILNELNDNSSSGQLITPGSKRDRCKDERDRAIHFIFQVLLKIISEMLVCSMVDPIFLSAVTVFYKILADTDLSHDHYPLYLRVFKESLDYVHTSQLVESEDNVKLISNLFSILIGRLNKNFCDDNAKKFQHADMSRKSLIMALPKLISKPKSLLIREVLPTMMAAIIVEMSICLESIENLKEFTPLEKCSELPPVTIMLVSVCSSKKEAYLGLAAEFSQHLKHDPEKLDSKDCLTIAQLFYILHKDTNLTRLDSEVLLEIMNGNWQLAKHLVTQIDKNKTITQEVDDGLDRIKLATTLIKAVKNDLAK